MAELSLESAIGSALGRPCEERGKASVFCYLRRRQKQAEASVEFFRVEMLPLRRPVTGRILSPKATYCREIFDGPRENPSCGCAILRASEEFRNRARSA